MPSSTLSRGNILTNILIGASLTPGALVASTTTPLTFTIPGLLLNDMVDVKFNGVMTAGVGIANAYVSAANVLTIVFGNYTAGTPTPTAGTYLISVDRSEYFPLTTNAL